MRVSGVGPGAMDGIDRQNLQAASPPTLGFPAPSFSTVLVRRTTKNSCFS